MARQEQYGALWDTSWHFPLILPREQKNGRKTVSLSLLAMPCLRSGSWPHSSVILNSEKQNRHPGFHGCVGGRRPAFYRCPFIVRWNIGAFVIGKMKLLGNGGWGRTRFRPCQKKSRPVPSRAPCSPLPISTAAPENPPGPHTTKKSPGPIEPGNICWSGLTKRTFSNESSKGVILRRSLSCRNRSP